MKMNEEYLEGEEEEEEENIPLKCQGQSAEKDDSAGSKFIYVLAFFSSIGGFLFGYDTGVISGAMLIIRAEMDLDDFWHGAIVSSTILAAWLFALVGGFLSDAVGRKPVILTASVLFIAGSVTMGIADGLWPLLIGRIIVGIGIGFVSIVVPVYIAEAARKEARGFLVTINTMSITGGQAVAAVTSGIFSSTHQGWRYMLGIAAIPAAIQCIGFFFMPESPRWLISKGRVEEGKKVLQRIRGRFYNIDDEFQSIQSSEKETKRELQSRKQRGQSSWIIVQIFQTPTVRRALLVGCLLHMFQQIAGINTVMYYSATIIQMGGFYQTSQAIWLSALVASVNFLCTFIGVYLVEKVGRRRLTLASLLGVVLALGFLAAGFSIVESSNFPVGNPEDEQCGVSVEDCHSCIEFPQCGFCFRDDPVLGITEGSCLESRENQSYLASEDGACSNFSLTSGFENNNGYVWSFEWCPSQYGWITVLGLIVYLFCFAPGMGPMPWTINSEIYPLWARSTCNSIAASVNWSFNFFVSMTFLFLSAVLTRPGVFLHYCIWSLVGLILLYWLLPETKGQTLEDVEALFGRTPSLCCRRKEDPSSVESNDKTVHSDVEDQCATEDQPT